jgi:hypothetical protein
MLPLLLLLLLASGTGATAKWMADDDIPSVPTEQSVTERTTVLKHYPDGTIDGPDNSAFNEYLRLSALNQKELERKVDKLPRNVGLRIIEPIVREHHAIERHLQRDYAEAIAENVSDHDLIYKYGWAYAALKFGKRFCE